VSLARGARGPGDGRPLTRQRGGESLDNLVPRTEAYVTFFHADIEAGNYSDAVVLRQSALVTGRYSIEPSNFSHFSVTP